MAAGAQPYKLLLYEPHTGQQVLHASKAQFRVCNTGRQWVKTWACVNEIAKAGWEGGKGHRSSWVAPTYKQAIELAWEELLNRFGPFDPKRPSLGAFKDVSVSERAMTWRSGGVTHVRTADNADSLRGTKNHFLVLDEAASLK